jgi:hypothetical protein
VRLKNPYMWGFSTFLIKYFESTRLSISKFSENENNGRQFD